MTSAKKATHKRVPVLTFAPRPEGYIKLSTANEFSIQYRSPQPLGQFYSDEVLATALCMSKTKRVRFEDEAPPQMEMPVDACEADQQLDEASKKAAKWLKKVGVDPPWKARKLQSLVKSAGMKIIG